MFDQSAQDKILDKVSEDLENARLNTVEKDNIIYELRRANYMYQHELERLHKVLAGQLYGFDEYKISTINGEHTLTARKNKNELVLTGNDLSKLKLEAQQWLKYILV